MESDALNVILEANLENFTDNDWPVEEIPVALPGHKSGKEDINVVDAVEKDLTEKPDWWQNCAHEAALALHPFADLAWNDYSLNCREIVAPRGEGNPKLNQI